MLIRKLVSLVVSIILVICHFNVSVCRAESPEPISSMSNIVAKVKVSVTMNTNITSDLNSKDIEGIEERDKIQIILTNELRQRGELVVLDITVIGQMTFSKSAWLVGKVRDRP